jgi:hypothetical protein
MMDRSGRVRTHLYEAPGIYLGNTLLETGSVIETWNNPEAILGMDCLCRYCIQIDCASGTMRFLDPEHLDVADLGKAFPLVKSPYVEIEHAGLFQERKGELLIDTGCAYDGCVAPKLFEMAVREAKMGQTPAKDVIGNETPDVAELQKCVWEGGNYTDIVIEKGPPNLIGMRFLARHLVTLNFPKGVMYLKFVTSGPLK